MSKALKIKIVLAYAAIYLLWGSTYLAIRFAVETIPPLFMAGARFFTAGLLIFGWMSLRGASLPGRALWLPIAAVGIPWVTLTYGLLTWAQQTVPSGLAALFFAMIPIWMVIFDWARPDGIRPRWPVIIGIGLGIAGVGLLVNPSGPTGSDGVALGGAAMLLIATVSWSLASIWSRHVPQPASKAQGVSIMMLSGSTMLLIISLLVGEVQSLELAATTLKSWLALAYLVVVGLIGHVAYMWLLTVSSAARVSTYAFVNPVVAIFLGVLLADETLSLRTVLCSVVIILAVMIIVLIKSRRENKTDGDLARQRSDIEINAEQRLHEST